MITWIGTKTSELIYVLWVWSFKIPNSKRRGVDGVHGYWLKKNVTLFYQNIAASVDECQPTAVTVFFYLGHKLTNAVTS